MPERIFLYGTLLPELAPRQVRPLVDRLVRLGPGQVRGRLHHLGPYPGLVLDPSGSGVRGAVFALPNDLGLLARLDGFEGFDPRDERGSLFVRRQAEVALDGGGTLSAWVYVYNRHPGKAPVIASGDYPAHCRGEAAPRPIDTGGIPWRERALTRVLLGAAGLTLSVSATTRMAARALERLARLGELPDEAFTRRTTVRRLIAIEETTRHWSLAEVLEHVLIVNRRVLEIVRALGERADPGPPWTVLDQKPRGRPAGELRGELRGLPVELLAAEGAVRDWRSPARHPHPWFGPLTARGWWALNALHNRVHLKQAARIRRSLGRAFPALPAR